MENLIDETYFWGELKIDGLKYQTNGVVQATQTNDRYDTLSLFIKKYQKKWLEKMFGSDIAELDVLPDDILDLILDTENKTSPIANYVYFFYQRSIVTTTTTTGEKKLNTQNTTNVPSINKMVLAWNEMVMENIEIHTQLIDMETIDTYNYITDIYPNVATEDDMFFQINAYGI